jgi:hypothetical protein
MEAAAVLKYTDIPFLREAAAALEKQVTYFVNGAAALSRILSGKGGRGFDQIKTLFLRIE